MIGGDVVLLIGTYARIPLGKWGVDDEMTIIKIDIDIDPATCGRLTHSNRITNGHRPHCSYLQELWQVQNHLNTI